MPASGNENEVGLGLVSLVDGTIIRSDKLAETSFKSKAFDLYYNVSQPRGGIMMAALNWVREFISSGSDQDWTTETRFQRVKVYVKRYRQLKQLQCDTEKRLTQCVSLKGSSPCALMDSFLLAQMERQDGSYVNFLMQLTEVAFSYHANSILFRINDIVARIDSAYALCQCDIEHPFELLINNAKLAILEQLEVMVSDGGKQNALCFCERSFRDVQVLSRCIRPFFVRPLSKKVLEDLHLYDFFEQMLKGITCVDLESKCLVTSFVGAVREVLEYNKVTYNSEARSSFCCFSFSSYNVKKNQIDYIDRVLVDLENQVDVGEVLSGDYKAPFVPTY